MRNCKLQSFAKQSKSWFLSRCCLPVLLLVYAEAPRYENLILLLCVSIVWGLQWSTCGSHCQDGRRQRIRRVSGFKLAWPPVDELMNFFSSHIVYRYEFLFFKYANSAS